MNILILGANGYIAHHCIRQLFSAGYTLLGLDFIRPKTTDVFQQFYTGDCGNVSLLKQITREHPIDYILYAAGSTDAMDCEKNPLPYYSNDVSGLLFTLSELKNISGIIFLSGIQSDLPQSNYQRIKNSAESILTSFHEAYGLSFIILRIADVLGVHPQSDSGPNRFHLLRRLLSTDSTQPPIIHRDYNFVHVEDVAQAVLCSLNKLKNPIADRYDIALNDWYLIEQFAQLVESCTHRQVTLPNYIERPAISRPKPDIFRARKALNWHLQYPDLSYMITTTVDWLRQHDQL